jgi:hypothetical protein
MMIGALQLTAHTSTMQNSKNSAFTAVIFGMTAARSKLAAPHTVKDAFGTETGVHNEDAA